MRKKIFKRDREMRKKNKLFESGLHSVCCIQSSIVVLLTERIMS